MSPMLLSMLAVIAVLLVAMGIALIFTNDEDPYTVQQRKRAKKRYQRNKKSNKARRK